MNIDPKKYYAFPSGDDDHIGGLFIRDYFATRAMQAIMQEPNAKEDYKLSEIAEDAYRMADAMLIARDKVNL